MPVKLLLVMCVDHEVEIRKVRVICWTRVVVRWTSGPLSTSGNIAYGNQWFERGDRASPS
jgi:hypothetical protein